MRNIYVVTSGEYSSYGIVAVYSSLKKALGGGGRVETYVLNDPNSEPIVRRLWQVRMTRDGKVDGHYSNDIERGQKCLPPRLWNGAYLFQVMAKTEKQAIKAANEQRTQLMALNRLPTKDGYLEKRKKEGW